MNNHPLDFLIKKCYECGSGDIRWCSISVRPYCGECNRWGRINYGTIEDAITDWNEQYKKHYVDYLLKYEESVKRIQDFEVICDETNNSQEDIDQRILRVEIVIKSNPIIEINIIIDKDGKVTKAE